MKLDISGMEVVMLEGVAMMTMSTGGKPKEPRRCCAFQIAKNLGKNNLMAKNWTRDGNDCDADN